MQLLDSSHNVIASEIRTMTGTWPNQVAHVEPITAGNLESVLERMFRERFCSHMLHDTSLRGSAYFVRHEDGTVEQLRFVNEQAVRGRPADHRLHPLTHS